MNGIISRIRRALQEAADKKTIETSHRFFREDECAKVWGVKMPEVNKIARSFFADIRQLPKAEIFGLCEELWKSGYLEETIVACNWSYAVREQYTPEDMPVFERWIDLYVDNWASCDTLCNHTVGELVERYPQSAERLGKWAVSPNRWMRRAAAVSLIIPARKGLFLDQILHIAGTVLTDSDHMVQKGYGWMLKAASEARRQEIFDFVIQNKTVMPRTALRYAIEKMPLKMRTEAMKR